MLKLVFLWLHLLKQVHKWILYYQSDITNPQGFNKHITEVASCNY